MVRQILVLFIKNYLKFLTIRQGIGKLLLFEKSLWLSEKYRENTQWEVLKLWRGKNILNRGY